jgi:hypothetical protein
MNPLEQNPAARRIAYQVFWVISLIAGATQIGFATADAVTPTWLLVVLSILPFLGAAIGYTAQANISPTTVAETPPENRGFVDGADPYGLGAPDERGAFDTGLLIGLACILFIICAIVWLVQAF